MRILTGSTRPVTGAHGSSFVDARARIEFIVAALSTFLASLVGAMVAILAVVFQREGYDLPSIGILLSLYAVPVLVLTVLSGAIIDRIGALSAFRWSIILSTLGLASLAFTKDQFLLASLSRVVQGIGFGLFMPAIMTYAQSRLDPRNFMSMVVGFLSVVPLSYGLSPPLAQWVLSEWGSGTMFAFAAGLGTASLVLTFGWRPLARPAETRGLAMSRGFRRRFILPLVCLFMTGSSWGFTGSFAIADLELRGLSAAWFYAPMGLTMVVARLGAGATLRRLQPPLLVALGAFLVAAGLAAFGLAPNVAVIVAAAIAMGIGGSVVYPIVSAMLGQGLPASERAGTQALATAIFYIGIYAMPFPISVIIGAWGYLACQLMIAIPGMLAAVALAMYPRESA